MKKIVSLGTVLEMLRYRFSISFVTDVATPAIVIPRWK